VTAGWHVDVLKKPLTVELHPSTPSLLYQEYVRTRLPSLPGPVPACLMRQRSRRSNIHSLVTLCFMAHRPSASPLIGTQAGLCKLCCLSPTTARAATSIHTHHAMASQNRRSAVSQKHPVLLVATDKASP